MVVLNEELHLIQPNTNFNFNPVLQKGEGAYINKLLPFVSFVRPLVVLEFRASENVTPAV